MSNNVPKRLADVIPVNVSREFEPSGWIGKDNRFHPEVRLRGLHWKAANISAEAVLIIERNLQGLVDAAIEAALDPAVEQSVRAEAKRRAEAKAANPAPQTVIYTEPAPENRVTASPLASILASRK